MRSQDEIIFLFDCDNTLIDNDRIHDDIVIHLEKEFGVANGHRYWQIFDQLRKALGYADYIATLQRYRNETANDSRIPQMSAYLRRYPFSERLYPGALDVIKHLGKWGPTVIMSDGDPTFQPYKIQESGLSRAVDGRVLNCIQKEKMLTQLQQRYPAHQYVMVDDNLRVLTAMKRGMLGRLTTVFSRQGQYAIDPHRISSYPAADLSVEHIANLLDYDLPALLRSSQHALEKPLVELSLM